MLVGDLKVLEFRPRGHGQSDLPRHPRVGRVTSTSGGGVGGLSSISIGILTKKNMETKREYN